MEQKTRDELVKEMAKKLEQKPELMNEIALPGVVQTLHTDNK